MLDLSGESLGDLSVSIHQLTHRRKPCAKLRVLGSYAYVQLCNLASLERGNPLPFQEDLSLLGPLEYPKAFKNADIANPVRPATMARIPPSLLWKLMSSKGFGKAFNRWADLS